MSGASGRTAALSPERKRALLAELLQRRAEGSAVLAPASHGQRALWFLHQLAPESAAYNVTFAARIETDLDAGALRRSLQALVDRHPALRTTFTARDGIPFQVIHTAREVQLEEADATTWSEEALNRRLVAESHRPFDLERGPLLRAYLFARSARERIFLLTVHHIVYDIVSLFVLLDELRVLYPAALVNAPASLPALAQQYTDYVRWQAEMLEGPDGQRLWAYWRDRLAGELPVLNLPTDRPRPPFQTYRGAVRPFTLDGVLTRRLKALAREQGATLYTTLLAAFQVLLHRYSGQDDLLVGSPMVGRSRGEFEGIVGYFINPVVMRADLSGNPPFTTFLGQVRRTVLAALEHQDYPFPLLVERLQPVRDPSRSPLFQVLFNMPKAHRLEEQGVSRFVLGEAGAGARMNVGGLELEVFPVEHRMAMFDLSLAMVEASGSISASLQYNTDLFEAATSARMVGHFLALLERILADPERRLSDLPLLTEGERRQVLVEWNATGASHPEHVCAHQLIEAQAERRPDALAVSAGDERVTYRQLERRANRVARRLVEHGVGPDVVVALLAERGVDLLGAILGVFKAGGAYLPLDPRHPAARLAQVLEQSEAPLVLAARALTPRLAQALAGLPAERRPRTLPIEEERGREDEPGGSLPPRCRPGDLAYVLYTSGSTGVPKGAMIEHRGMLNHLCAKVSELRLTEADVVAQTASQCFDISVWQLLAALLVGGRVHVVADDAAYDPPRLLEEADRQRISILETVPSLLRAMLEEIARRGPARPALSTLRWVIPTGEALAPELCRQWLGFYPSIPLLNAYGPTECSDDVTHHPIHHSPPADVVRVPIGRPIPNMRLYVLDRYLQPAPIGVAGELCVGGVGVGRGYLNDPARTAEAFVPDLFAREPGARLYKTGDLGRYRPDGTLEFLGRLDQQVKVRGLRIELGEIEAVLRRHPAVREAVVLAREAAPGDTRLVAYVVAGESPPPPALELRQLVAQRLPEYMMPSAFVALEAMPLTPNGKLDRRALPAPDWGRRGEAAVAPRTPVEARLAAIWARVLGVEQVGVHDDFFEAGGHSMLAMQLVSQVRESFGVDLPARSFFEAPTVAGLARAIEADGAAGPSAPAAAMTVAELAVEAVLDAAIRPPAPAAGPAAGPARILLTGATGFLGTFLLHTLLRQTPAAIVCLVRASSAGAAGARIRGALESYSLWEERFDDRIVPVEGDLAQPLLGLSVGAFEELARTVEAIYHNGALVNFLYPYRALRAANVLGTQEVLRLASRGRLKPVHFVSTVSVFGTGGGRAEPVVREEDSLDGIERLVDGYSQSKWVAERLVSAAGSRGLPVRIYRPGRITGHSRSGACSADDLLVRLFRLCIRLGSAPDLDMPVDMTPVDYVSSALVHLSQRGAPRGEAFHLVNPRPARLGDVVDWIRAFGYPLKSVPSGAWLAELTDHAGPSAGEEIGALLSILSERVEKEAPGGGAGSLASAPRIDCRNALDGLADTSLACPPADAQLLGTYLRYCLRAGLLDPPPRVEGPRRTGAARAG